MGRTTRCRSLTLVAGIGLAGLVAGTGAASAQGGPTRTAPAGRASDAGSAAATGTGAATAGQAGQTAQAAQATAGVCAQSDLPAHTGFQVGPACVSTPFGELDAPDDNPQLLITEAPEEVAVGQA